MSVYRLLNPGVNRLLRSASHRLLSKRVMIVSYQGRRSGRDYDAVGRLCAAHHQQQVDIMHAYFKAVPQDKKFYGVTCGTDNEPNRVQVEQALHGIDIIEFTLL